MLEEIFRRKAIIKKFKNTLKKNKNKQITKEYKDIFIRCSGCNENIATINLDENLQVCPNCNYHFPLSAHTRIKQIFDPHSFKEIDKKYQTKNTNNFPNYQKSLEKYRKKSNLNEAVVCGLASINQIKVATAILDSNFMMGSMGAIVGDKITRIIEYATKHKLPLIIFSASGGARMQEGIMSLVQMAKTSAALKKHDDAKLLYISVITSPTTGGVSASFASLGNIVLAEPNALFGFAGKRVIQATIKEELPANFQTSEYVLECGFIDKIVARKDLSNNLSTILKLHGGNK